MRSSWCCVFIICLRHVMRAFHHCLTCLLIAMFFQPVGCTIGYHVYILQFVGSAIGGYFSIPLVWGLPSLYSPVYGFCLWLPLLCSCLWGFWCWLCIPQFVGSVTPLSFKQWTWDVQEERYKGTFSSYLLLFHILNWMRQVMENTEYIFSVLNKQV